MANERNIVGRIEFDPKKLQMVEIDKVVPNPWNPKDKDTSDFAKVKQSIEKKGLRTPVIVRERGDIFEIIDGEQRFTACKELGFSHIWVYNEGVVSDKEAQELTIWFQQQVPFNEIDLAQLVASIVKNPDFELPFSEGEIDHFKEMVSFNFDEYKTDAPDIEISDEKDTKQVTCPECGHKFDV